MSTITTTPTTLTLFSTTHLRRSNHRTTLFSTPLSLKSLTTSSLKPLSPNPNNPNITIPLPLINSTKTLTTLLTLTLTLASKLITPPISLMKTNILPTVTPLFFASMRDRPSGYLNTPLTVVASGMAKWLDIYSGVLMVRVLLSWFPNIPWDRQPLSAIRDLCDPYLNLFRNIIPPVFDTLDVSPLLAFAVLGTLGSILSSAKGI